MARVPVYQRQLSTAPISAPRIQPDIADTSGLTQGLNDATRAATQIALEERAKADTAALMSADQQLAEWKQQALFGTDGVYTRKGGQALDITGQTLPAFDQKVSELEEGLRTPAQRERWSIIKRNQREALSNELAKYEFGQREQYYDEVADLRQVDNATARRSLLGEGAVRLEQDGDQPRGFIQFGDDRRFEIKLTERANLSTLLHETGHFYLEVLGDLAARDNAPEQIRNDYQTLLGWFGVEGRDAIGTEQHEQFARGFEAYLREGKAPTRARCPQHGKRSIRAVSLVRR